MLTLRVHHAPSQLLRIGAILALLFLSSLLVVRGISQASAQLEASSDIPFDEHTVINGYDWPMSIKADDIDRDGDIDFLSAASGNTDAIAWWENDGNQNFTGHVVGAAVNSARCALAADLDGDLDTDIVGSSYMDDDVIWWENDGSENFTSYTIDGNFDGADEIFVVDLDGDDDLDVLGAGWDADTIVWWENDGSQGFTKRTIDSNFEGATAVYAADVDGDTDTDVLGAADQADDVTWWENDGTPADGGWSEHTVSGSSDGANSVLTIDLDGDGDMDVLSSAWLADRVSWYENDGSENFNWHEIDNTLDNAGSVHSIDMDKDSDLDVIAIGTLADDVVWYENNGSEQFTKRIIAGAYNGANSVFPVDVDGDTDIDLVGAAYDADEITWWEQMPIPINIFLPLVLRDFGLPGTPVLSSISNPGGSYAYTVGWSAVGGTSNYVLEEADDGGFSNPRIVYTGPNTSKPMFMTSLGTYYYRVRAANQVGTSGWSNIESVVVTVEPPLCPQPGTWSGTTSQSLTINFDISSAADCQIQNLHINFYCVHSGGLYVTGETFPLIDVTNYHFEASGSTVDLTGDFGSITSGSGTLDVQFYPPGLGLCTATGTWTADYNSP